MTLPKPRRPASVRLLLTFALLAGITCPLIGLSDSETTPLAVAAPHTVREVDHPFNQEWLDVSLVLAAKCAGCHFAGSELPDLSSYDALVDARNEDGEPIIIPGKPDESWLWEQVVWNHDANPDSEDPDEPLMPSDDEGEWLTAGQLVTLRHWIEQGALEYRLPETCSTRPLLETEFPRREGEHPTARIGRKELPHEAARLSRRLLARREAQFPQFATTSARQDRRPPFETPAGNRGDRSVSVDHSRYSPEKEIPIPLNAETLRICVPHQYVDPTQPSPCSCPT